MTVPGIGTFSSPRGSLKGGDVQLRDLLVDIVLEHEKSRPRTQQTTLGPSEIGEPCARKLGYKISRFPEPFTYVDDPWFAIMGTATHSWIAGGLERINKLAIERGEQPPWLIEERVSVRPGLDGSLDAYNWLMHRVVDHKIVGKTGHDKYRKLGPSTVYEVQIQAYGVGAVNKGLPVDKVSIAFYPRFDNITRSMYVWTDDFKPEIVYKALARLDIIEELVRQLRPLADPIQFTRIPKLPSVDCRLCPWFKPGQDTGATCPGNTNI